jgi:hypothetical protein
MAEPTKSQQWAAASPWDRLKLLVDNYAETSGTAVPKFLKEAGAATMEPLVTVPRVEGEFAKEHPAITGAVNAVGGFAGGMTSPMAVTTMAAFGPLSKIPGATRVLAGAFGLKTASDTIESFPDVVQDVQNPDVPLEQKVEEGVGVALNATLSALMLKHAATPAAPVAGNVPPASTAKPPAVVPATPSVQPVGEVMRGLNERAVESKTLPKPVEEAVKASPESYYKKQSVPDVEAELATKAEVDLLADFQNASSNTRIASMAELMGRKIQAGDDAGATSVMLEAGKLGTTLGQLVNQYKLFKYATPEGIRTIVNKGLQAEGYDPMNPAQAARLDDMSKAALGAAAKLKEAKAAYQENPGPATWGAVDDGLKALEAAEGPLNAYAARMAPKTYGDLAVSTMQGNLMAPISLVFNAFANVSRYPLAAGARGTSALIDAIDYTRIGRREVALSPIAGSKAKYMAMAKAVPEAGRVMLKGATGTELAKGEVKSVHNATDAIANLAKYYFDQSSLDVPMKAGRVPLADVGKMWMESTLGLPADVFLRGVTAGDIPFKAAERARVINEFGKLKGLTPEEMPRALKSPDMFFSKPEMKDIEFESARAVYQQNNWMGTQTNSVLNSARELSPVAYYAARGVIPFTRTPINVLSELLTYTPAGLLKVGHDIKTGNTREAKLTAGKVAVGSTVIAGGTYLYRKGVITPSVAGYDGKEREAAYATVPPGHLNASALQRMTSGKDGWNNPLPDDRWVDATRFGLTGGLMLIGADAIRRKEEDVSSQMDAADKAGQGIEMLAASGMGAVSYTVNQSFLRGVNQMLDSLAKNEPDKWLGSYLETVSAPVAPNVNEAISRYFRDYKPDFREDNAFKFLVNRFKSKWGNDTEGLPLRRDIWGRAIPETPAGADKFANIFFDVTKSREAISDPVDAELYRLWRRTNNDEVWPSSPSLTVNLADKPYTLTPEQHNELVKQVGYARRTAIDAVVGKPDFQKIPDNLKIEILKKIYDGAGSAGRLGFYLKAAKSGWKLTPATEASSAFQP